MFLREHAAAERAAVRKYRKVLAKRRADGQKMSVAPSNQGVDKKTAAKAIADVPRSPLSMADLFDTAD